MLSKLVTEFFRGIEKIKWFFSLLAERIKVEIALIRLLGKSEQYTQEKNRLLIAIGTRIVELKRTKKTNVLEDTVIRKSLKDLEKLEGEIEQLRKTAQEISAVEA